MKEKKDKSYVVVMCISVACLLVIIASITYAYFRPRIVGEGANIRVTMGKADLDISETKITANNLVPILDSTKDTKAQKNIFTISPATGSTKEICYTLFLVVDELGEMLKTEKYSKYLKYELEYTDNTGVKQTLTYDMSTYNIYVTNPDVDGKVRLPLVQKQQLDDTDTSREYTLRIWLSFSDTEDQTELLTTTAENKTFKAHILASGGNGTCPTE